MSLRRLLCGIFLSSLAVLLISVPAVAQEEVNPKIEIFVGYQWLHPGITVPSLSAFVLPAGQRWATFLRVRAPA